MGEVTAAAQAAGSPHALSGLVVHYQAALSAPWPWLASVLGVQRVPNLRCFAGIGDTTALYHPYQARLGLQISVSCSIPVRFT